MKVKGLEAVAQSLNERAVGESIAGFQVLGINSLKTATPPDALIGQQVRAANVEDGMLVLHLSLSDVVVDLQRTGTLVWTPESNPWSVGAGPMPTLRVTLGSGGSDLTEPARTKRIAVWIKPSADPTV